MFAACEHKTEFFCPAQHLKKKKTTLDIKSPAECLPFSNTTQLEKATELCLSSTMWHVSTATGLGYQVSIFFLFFIFSFFSQREGRWSLYWKQVCSIQFNAGHKTEKEKKLKEFVPAGFSLNTSEFFVANETRNIWRSFPTRRGFKILHFITAINHWAPVCTFFFSFLQFSGTFVLEKWRPKHSAPST